MQIDRDIIMQAKEKLGDQNAFLIAETLEIPDFNERDLKCCCPFHQENHASFIYNRKAYNFRCFGACGRSYDLIDALMYKGATYTDAVKTLLEKADMPFAIPEHHVKTKRSYRYPHEEPLGDKTEIYQYLAKRKISQQTADYLDIRQDAKGNLVFNYYDTNDVLTMVKYRPARQIKKGENKNWCQKDADTTPLLFNMNRCNPASPLLICSGELDCAAAIESGWLNAVSIPLGDQNTEWRKECADFLEQFDTIIICADNDESGAKYLKDILPRLRFPRANGRSKVVRGKTVNIPKYLPNSKGENVFIKDLNEYLYYCGRQATFDLIVNASDTPIDSVVDLSDVEPVDYDDMNGIRIGLSSLDKNLTRIFLSTLTVVSGRPGSGKSSFLAQLVCQAMEQGFKTWIFSGELPNGMNKGWMNLVMAGRRNIEKKVSRYGNSYLKVSPQALAGINKRYRGQWFIYRDDWDNDIETLIHSMEDVVTREDVKLLILDNFMCIDPLDDKEELQSQTEIIKRLVKFAREYQTAVVLVCHPRKFDSNTDMDIYDIAGSSNIVNLAHRTIGLRRIYDKERHNTGKLSDEQKKLLKYDVVATIIKDRMYGRQNIDCGVFYDEISRRFYTTDEEFDYHYSWDTQKYDDALHSEKIAKLKEDEGDEDEVFGAAS